MDNYEFILLQSYIYLNDEDHKWILDNSKDDVEVYISAAVHGKHRLMGSYFFVIGESAYSLRSNEIKKIEEYK
jgi:hypothetical protein